MISLVASLLLAMIVGGGLVLRRQPTAETVTADEPSPTETPLSSRSTTGTDDGPQPSLELERTTGLRDGDSIRFSVVGMAPGTNIAVNICGEPLDDGGPCDLAGTAVERTTDANGGAGGVLRLRQWLFTRRGWIDCSAPSSPCVAQVLGSGGTGPSVRLSFATHVERPEPMLSMRPPGPHQPGDVVRLEGRELPADVEVQIAVCEAGVDGRERHCVTPAAGRATTDDDGRVEIENYPLVVTHALAGLDCRAAAEGCELAWYPGLGAPAYVATPIVLAD